MHINTIFIVFLLTPTFYKNVWLPTEVLSIMILQQLAKDDWISKDFFFVTMFISTYGNIFNTGLCYTIEKDIFA